MSKYATMTTPENLTDHAKKLLESEQVKKMWECSECGDQSYTSTYSEDEVNECLQCPVCGGVEFDLKDAKP